jgi:hypothetical protein
MELGWDLLQSIRDEAEPAIREKGAMEKEKVSEKGVRGWSQFVMKQNQQNKGKRARGLKKGREKGIGGWWKLRI